MKSLFKISEDSKYGVSLSIDDAELADNFDDYLNDSCYVLVDIKFHNNYVEFYFGQAACVEKVNCIIEKFILKNKIH